MSERRLEMTLTNQINEFREEFLPQLPEGVAGKLDEGVQKMLASHGETNGLKVGQKMPSFSLSSATERVVYSENLLKEGTVVISFYRGGWCPYCNLELRALQDILPEIEKHGGSLLAISPELPDNSLSTQEKNELEFPVLSDTDNLVARSFGLEIDVPDLIVKLSKDLWELGLTKLNGTEKHILPVPATYVVGSDGLVKYAFVDADYTKRAEPAEILKALGNQ